MFIRSGLPADETDALDAYSQVVVTVAERTFDAEQVDLNEKAPLSHAFCDGDPSRPSAAMRRFVARLCDALT